VLLGEMVEELIAAVGDEGGEVGAVCQLEGQDRLGMAGMQPLQLWHSPSLLSWGAGDIWVSAGIAVTELRAVPARRLSWPDRRTAPGAWPPGRR
jgi:hypothetical protein